MGTALVARILALVPPPSSSACCPRASPARRARAGRTSAGSRARTACRGARRRCGTSPARAIRASSGSRPSSASTTASRSGSRSRPPRRRTGSTSTGSVGTRGTARARSRRSRRARRCPRPNPRASPTPRPAWSTAGTGPSRRRGPCRPTRCRACTSPASPAATPAARATSSSSCATTNAPRQILFQTNDTTWQAYNQYGGNSLYAGSPVGRAYKVSYNRPFTAPRRNPYDSFFSDQYPMVRFLERNGYDVSYFSGLDADQHRRRDARPHGVPVERARRVLVEATASQRRGGAGRGREPRLLLGRRGRSGRRAGSRASTDRRPRTARWCRTRRPTRGRRSTRVPSGPARGVIRASARRPTADDPRTR